MLNRQQDEKLEELENFASRLAGKGLREPLQVVLIVMFVGVIAVGIWHGIATQNLTEAIRESTEVFKSRTEWKENK
jgi:hypothetical protein